MFRLSISGRTVVSASDVTHTVVLKETPCERRHKRRTVVSHNLCRHGERGEQVLQHSSQYCIVHCPYFTQFYSFTTEVKPRQNADSMQWSCKVSMYIFMVKNAAGNQELGLVVSLDKTAGKEERTR